MATPTNVGAQVRELLQKGVPHNEIARRVGCARPTVSYHARRLGFPAKVGRGIFRYDWEAIQAYYDEGHSYRECRAKFGFSRAAWGDAVKRGAIKPRYRSEMPLEKRATRGSVRGAIIRQGLLEYKCANCGIDEWMGEPLSLNLHHKNGDGQDHRIENMEWLCPNCHSLTDTFCGRNIGNGFAHPSTATA